MSEKLPFVNVNRYKPEAASKALIQVNPDSLCLNSTTDRNGTSTTDRPVIKPAFEVVV
ncbi:hypothetical protein D3C77_628490 [compost metagenome]